VSTAAVQAAVLFAESIDEALPAGLFQPKAHRLCGIAEVVERDHRILRNSYFSTRSVGRRAPIPRSCPMRVRCIPFARGSRARSSS
jgi:hypothetical protein